jgi:hypothetical protein
MRPDEWRPTFLQAESNAYGMDGQGPHLELACSAPVCQILTVDPMAKSP